MPAHHPLEGLASSANYKQSKPHPITKMEAETRPDSCDRAMWRWIAFASTAIFLIGLCWAVSHWDGTPKHPEADDEDLALLDPPIPGARSRNSLLTKRIEVIGPPQD